MYSLANFRSKDHSTSSKTSRNVCPSSPVEKIEDKVCKIKEDLGRGFKHGYTAPAHAPSKNKNKKVDNLPRIVKVHDFDTSDSEDCESVGSNSPAFESTNLSGINQRTLQIEKCSGKPEIHCKNSSIKENPSKMQEVQKNVGVISKTNEPHGNYIPRSMLLSTEDTSSDVIPKKTNNTINLESTKHFQKDEGKICAQSHTQLYPVNDISKTNDTNHMYTKNQIKDSSTMQKITSKKHNSEITRLDNEVNFDDGERRSHPNTTNKTSVFKCTDTASHPIQNQIKAKQNSIDDGDGGGFDSRSYTSSRRYGKHRRHGRPAQYERISSEGGEQRYRGSSRGSRGGGGSGGSGGSGVSGGSGLSEGSGGSAGRRRGQRGRRGSRGSSGSRGSRGSRGSSSRSKWGGQDRNNQARSGREGCRSQPRRESNQSSPRSSSRSSQGNNSQYSTTYGMDKYETLEYKPYPAKWRCFGRRPPAIHEFRSMGEGRVKNVRPAGKPAYLMRVADEKRGCQGPSASDMWDVCYGLAKPITDHWSTPLPYGTQVIRAGDIDTYFCPSRGDVIIINPAQNFYRAMKSGYVTTYRGRGYNFGVGDLIVRLGRFMPNGEYIPYGNLELYMHTQTREMRLLGRQPFLLVDFNYHNLDYESPGKHLAIGTFLNESFFPRRGDIIIRGGAWAENYPNVQRKHHSSVKYWRPRMEFLPNDMLLRPYVDIGCNIGRKFYWGAAELYTYSGKGLAWAYWGRDNHICDTPYPREQEHGIKTGHHKDEVGHYANGVQPTHSHR